MARAVGASSATQTDCPAVNVLITSAGRRVALVRHFRDALGELGLLGKVFAADASRLSPAAQVSDGYVTVPPCSDPDYIPILIEACASLGISLVVPTIDPELPILSSKRDAFSAHGIVVLVSSPETVSISGDKLSTYRWLTLHGYPAIETAPFADRHHLPPNWRPPLVVKPRAGSGSSGVRVARTWAELDRIGGHQGCVVQPLVTGEEYSIDLWIGRRGGVECAVPRLRLATRAGESSKGMTCHVEELESLAFRIGGQLPGPFGPLTIQAFLTRDGARVVEINPRFAGGYPLSYAAGANFPRWALEELRTGSISSSRRGWTDRLVMLRYDEAVFVDGDRLGV